MTHFTCKVASVTGSESELTDALQTIRYHYLCKIYLPMYRALHWETTKEQHLQQQQPLLNDAKSSWNLMDQNNSSSSNRTRDCVHSRLIEKSTFHKALQLRSRLPGYEKRIWNLTEKRKSINAESSSSPYKSLSNDSSSDVTTNQNQMLWSSSIYNDDHSRRVIDKHQSTGDIDSRPTMLKLYGTTRQNIANNSDSTQESWTDINQNFEATQVALQQEARMALAMAQSMARMQLEVEKQTQKSRRPSSSPSSFSITLEIPHRWLIRGGVNQLTISRMNKMTYSQIQLVANDLLSQIEELNEELMRLLMERDELHMEQDSVLVDIDDFTRRAQETNSTEKLHQWPQGGAAAAVSMTPQLLQQPSLFTQSVN